MDWNWPELLTVGLCSITLLGMVLLYLRSGGRVKIRGPKGQIVEASKTPTPEECAACPSEYQAEHTEILTELKDNSTLMREMLAEMRNDTKVLFQLQKPLMGITKATAEAIRDGKANGNVTSAIERIDEAHLMFDQHLVGKIG